MKFAVGFISLFALVSATPIEVDERAPAVDDANDLVAKSADPAEAEYQNLGARNYPATANPGPGGVTLKCRTGPSIYHDIRAEYSAGESIEIVCQTAGQSISGNEVWNRIHRTLAFDCYVSDFYTKTGHKWIPGVPRC